MRDRSGWRRRRRRWRVCDGWAGMSMCSYTKVSDELSTASGLRGRLWITAIARTRSFAMLKLYDLPEAPLDHTRQMFDCDFLLVLMEKRFDAVDDRFDRIEKLILADHKRRIERLEEQVRTSETFSRSSKTRRVKARGFLGYSRVGWHMAGFFYFLEPSDLETSSILVACLPALFPRSVDNLPECLLGARRASSCSWGALGVRLTELLG
jgi:hypothetical protein